MKKKLYVVSLMILIIINMLSISVSALSFTVTMTPSNTKIEAGTEVVISVKLSSLNVGDEGINALSTTLGYDAAVFETLTDANIEGSNDWMSAYSTGTGRITLTRTSFVNSDEEIMQITLKVKSDVASGTKGTVDLSNILAANADSEIGSSNVSTTITVGDASSSETPDDTDPDEDPSINDIISDNNDNSDDNNDNNDNNDDNSNDDNNDSNDDDNVSVITPITNSPEDDENIVEDTDNNTVNQIDQIEEDMPYTGSEKSDFMKIILGLIIIALLIYRKIYSLEDI